MKTQTLKEWSRKQPHELGKLHSCFFISDTNLIDRSEAWDLIDFRVSSVSGGTIWFVRKGD